MSYTVLMCPHAQRQIRGLAMRDQNRLKLRILDLGRDPLPADARQWLADQDEQETGP